MATAQSVTYRVASGASVNAGRFAGGRFAGGLPVDDFVLSGIVDSSAPPVNALVGIWGQSNANGEAFRTDLGAPPLNADPGLAVYDAAAFDRVWIWTGATFAKLNPSTNNGATVGYFGPEFGLAVRWMRETTGVNLYLVKNAAGSQDISKFKPPSGTMWTAGATKHSDAEAWLVTNSVAISLRAMVFVQGEADFFSSESAYRADLNSVTTGWLANSIVNSGDRVMLWQMHPSTSNYGSGVFAAKAAFAAANSYAVAPTLPYYMKGDNLHLNGRGQVQVGYDSATEIFGFAPVSV